jgi:hypothetical protein
MCHVNGGGILVVILIIFHYYNNLFKLQNFLENDNFISKLQRQKQNVNLKKFSNSEKFTLSSLEYSIFLGDDPN